ncbi:MAG: putative sugar nucleotidyl transferase [Saprospiraceae bacterium]|nr:putative sugar nucleotidyl transferase [Saprospiraceae bacterium]
MNIILFDTDHRDHLLPFTFTRPVSELRIGMLTVREKWQLVFPGSIFSHITSEFLESQFPMHLEEENLLINGALLPNDNLEALIKNLALNEALMLGGELLSARLSRSQFDRLTSGDELEDIQGYELGQHTHRLVDQLWDIIEWNGMEIISDIERIQVDRGLMPSEEIPHGTNGLFIMPGAKIERCLFNTDEGPIYVGQDVMIMDGATVRGPTSIGAYSRVKMNSTLYAGTSIGPHCEVAGEIKNSILFDHSNKSHAGYLGDSVLGAYCNLGALTTASNLKNTFGSIRLWNYQSGTYQDSGRTKCGLFMGDYSRTAIQTSFNSGTVVGVSAHVFGSGFPPKYIPSFTWGGIMQNETYEREFAILACQRLHELKGSVLTDTRREILEAVFKKTEHNRTQTASNE